MIIRKNIKRLRSVFVPKSTQNPNPVMLINQEESPYTIRINNIDRQQPDYVVDTPLISNKSGPFNNYNSYSDIKSREFCESQLWNTEILTDQILRNTEVLIQRDIMQHKEKEPSSKTLGQDKDRRMINQIQETCKLYDQTSALQSKVAKERRSNTMMEHLIQPQDQFEQDRTLHVRQQAVLQKFYQQSMQNPGIDMSEKLQKLTLNKPNIQHKRALSSKDARTLELFSQLGDDKQHEKLLESALLLDFFLQDKKSQQMINVDPKARKFQSPEQSKAALEKWLVLHQKSQVRMKLRGLDQISQRKNRLYFSQHQDEAKKKKSEERQENMAIITEKTNQYKINIVRQFIKNDLQLKKKENIQVIDYLMDFNPRNLPNEIKDSVFQRKISISEDQDVKQKSALSMFTKNTDKGSLSQSKLILILRKCFFRYSNKDEADFSKIYREMHQHKLFEFLHVVGICPAIVEKQFVLEISHKMMKNKQTKVLNFEEFLELIRKVAYQFCISTSPSKYTTKRRNNITLMEVIQVFQDDKSNSFSEAPNSKDTEMKIDHKSALAQFGAEILQVRETSMLEPLELEIRQARYIKQFLIKFEPIQNELFTFSFQLKGVMNLIPSNSFLKFDDIFELLWKIDLFPRLIAKSTIRYYFYYMVNNNDGLDQEYFGHFLNIIGLSIIRGNINRLQLIQQVVKEKKSTILSHILSYFKTLDRMDKQSLNLMAEIGLFYMHTTFLNSANLSQQMNKILLDQHKPGN